MRESELAAASRLRCDHLAHPCFDVAATRAFYGEALGLPLVFAQSGQSEEWGGEYLLMAYALGDGRCLDFFALRGARRPPPDPLPPDMRHIGLTAGSHAGVKRSKRRLDEFSIAWRSEEHGEGDEHLYLDDPNGLILEIAAHTDRPRAPDPDAAAGVLRRWERSARR
jgi:catechol 2,3-dioxygenase-like lactoylglutathione lyase family enzyme